MILQLTESQSSAIRPHLRPGTTLLAVITREPFDGANAEQSGALTIQFGPVSNAALAVVRKALEK